MTDEERYYLAHKDSRKPDDIVPPAAHSIRILDCGESQCQAAHILLLDSQGDGIAQATVTLDMAKTMLNIIIGRKLGYAKSE